MDTLPVKPIKSSNKNSAASSSKSSEVSPADKEKMKKVHNSLLTSEMMAISRGPKHELQEATEDTARQIAQAIRAVHNGNPPILRQSDLMKWVATINERMISKLSDPSSIPLLTPCH